MKPAAGSKSVISEGKNGLESVKEQKQEDTSKYDLERSFSSDSSIQ